MEFACFRYHAFLLSQTLWRMLLMRKHIKLNIIILI